MPSELEVEVRLGIERSQRWRKVGQEEEEGLCELGEQDYYWRNARAGVAPFSQGWTAYLQAMEHVQQQTVGGAQGVVGELVVGPVVTQSWAGVEADEEVQAQLLGERESHELVAVELALEQQVPGKATLAPLWLVLQVLRAGVGLGLVSTASEGSP